MSKLSIRNILVTIYVLLILGFSASAKAAYNVMPANPIKSVKTVTYQGALAMTIDGHYYLVLDDETFFELKSAQNLSAFNGWMVEVAGYETLAHKVGPIFSPASLDPLSEEHEKTVAAPVFFVTSINGISLIE